MTAPISNPAPQISSFAGQLLLQEDAEGLAVTLRLTESRVTLFSGRSELGAWPASGVSITALGGGRYEFLAEGDLLTFIPDELELFTDNPLVTALAPLPPPKRFRMRRPRPETSQVPATPKAPDRPPTTPAPAPVDVTPPSPAEEVAPPPRPDKPKRRMRVKRVKAGRDRTERLPKKKPRAETLAVAAAKPAPKRRQLKAESTGLSGRQRLWLATIDQARNYDLLGLDRVPVTRKMRQEAAHKHTWDHRVSAGFASRHLCTICGKVRISAKR